MRKLILFLLFTAIVAILAFPGMALTSAKDGLVLWAASLVPTLFPFMVITSLIVQYSGARGKKMCIRDSTDVGQEIPPAVE